MVLHELATIAWSTTEERAKRSLVRAKTVSLCEKNGRIRWSFSRAEKQKGAVDMTAPWTDLG
jgi:hypothetical protein